MNTTEKLNSILDTLVDIISEVKELRDQSLVKHNNHLQGIAIAKEAGKYKGKPKTVDREAVKLAMSKEGASFRKVAKQLNISLSTVQRVMKENE